MNESNQKECKRIIIIPAHRKSSRLPSKLLIDINGKPLLQHTWENCLKAPNIDGVFIATSDKEIADIAAAFDAVVLLKDKDALNGTDCVLKAGRAIAGPKTLINVQGEWATVNPDDIDIMSRDLTGCQVSSLFYTGPMTTDPNRVRVVLNNNSEAMYFSRSSIPYGATEACYHVGVYAFSDEFCMRDSSQNDLTERLEQLVWLKEGIPIRMHETSYTFGIDGEEDLKEYVASVQKSVCH